LVVIWLDLADPSVALDALGSPDTPFEAWLRRQLQHALGVDLTTLVETRGELILEWTDKEGAT
jgi:hypothetical protein